MTRAALWLARRELAARGRRVALAAAVIAALAAAVTATELVARAREAAVAAEVDAIGPALTLAPAGTTPGQLARAEIAGTLPPAAEAAARRALGDRLRAVERRVLVHREIAGVRRLVIGVDSGPAQAGGGAVAAIGAELARSLSSQATIAVDGRELAIARVLPSTGTVDDLAVTLPMALVRAPGPNALRLFLAAGVSPQEAGALLERAAAPGVAVIRSDRGEVADRELHASLARHRAAAYAVMAAVAILTLLVAAHLDAAERRVELATLAALGASRATLVGGLLARSAAVAGAGAVAGALAGVAVAAAVEPALQAVTAATLGLAGGVAGAGVLVGAAAGTPTAVLASARDPVRELQEG